MHRRVKIYFALVLWSAVLSATYAQEPEAAPCSTTVDVSGTFNVNCSRRNIDDVPRSWPAAAQDVGADDHVLITFFNNSISQVTELPAISGARVAVSFKSNRIFDIDDDAFQNIPTLIYLDLSNNMITGEVLRSEIFQGPYEGGVYGSLALETLILGHNKIHSLDRNLFQYTPNLTRLYLNDNPIEILDLVTMLAIASVNLKVLDLAYTDIESVPLDAFKTLTQLNQLELSGNKLLAVPDGLSLVGATLESLGFNNNPIVELNDDSFIGLSNLKVLEVGENDLLEEVKRETFSPLKSLRTLHLCHNKNLRYISHNAFKGLKDQWTIKEMYLNDNNLNELPTDLMPWSKLNILGMSGNNWLCNCDLANIVTKLGAGEKFQDGDIPFCVAPMRWSGMYVTNVTLDICPTFDKTFTTKKSFSISSLRPKHLLWGIFAVAMVALFGMLLGLLVNTVKAFYKKNIRSQPIRYINIKHESNFS